MPSTFSAAVVGTGFIGPVHVEGLRRAGVHVAGICGSSPVKSCAAAKRLGLPRGYASLEELLADATVDSVHLTTPNHFAQAAAALRAGKHVICEKPLAMNSRESAELVRIAASSGRTAAVAYNIRFYPLCHEAANRVRTGSLGEMLHVNGSYVQDWLLFDTDFNWRVLAKAGGELRAVADIGTHWLDLIQFISGQRIVAVYADLRTVHRVRQRPRGTVETFSSKCREPATSEQGAAGQGAAEQGAAEHGAAEQGATEQGATEQAATEPIAIDTDDCGCVMLHFEHGANGCLWVSQTTAGRKNCLRFEIAGSRQSLAWNSESPGELWIGHRDRPNELLLRDPALLGELVRAITDYPGGHNEGFPDTFKQLFRSFYGYIAGGDFCATPPFPTFADGHREILLCEAVLTSHREQRWVSLEEGLA
jgi:predicted dehydrogenase